MTRNFGMMLTSETMDTAMDSITVTSTVAA